MTTLAAYRDPRTGKVYYLQRTDNCYVIKTAPGRWPKTIRAVDSKSAWRAFVEEICTK